MATAAEINEIIKLYVGYYNRAPDPAGLNFWIRQFDGGFSLDAMAVDFSTQPETLLNYPFFLNATPSVEQYGLFVDAVYQNLFNREPDVPGREFWSTKIASGDFSVGEAISLIIAGATTSPDQDVVANKVAVGVDFFIKTNAQPTYVFDADDITEATAIQASVTADAASVTAATARTDTYISNLGATTINLTVEADQPGGGGNSVDTQGSAGNDTYSGTVEAAGGGTLQTSDNLAASGGDDTLNVRVISTSPGGEVVSPSASGLENVVVSNETGNGVFIIDFTNITGEMTVTAANGGDSTLTGFGNLDAGTLVRMENVDGIVAAHFKGDRAASENDAFSLFIQDSGTETLSSTFQLSDAQANNADTTFEIVNIETGGTEASFLDLARLELGSLVVTGSQQLNVEETFDGFLGLSAVDASGMTGGGINVRAPETRESDFSFMGSGFDDTVFLSRSVFSGPNTLSLDGGDGTDTLIVDRIDNLSATEVNAVTSFEILQSDGPTTNLNASEYTNIQTFVFDGQNGNNGRINIDGVTAEDTFIFESDVGQGDEAVRFDADTAGQSLTFELNAQTDADGEVTILADTNSGNSYAAIGFASGNITSVEIVSSGSNDNANMIAAVDTGSNIYSAIDNEGGPSNFTISGSHDLNIGAQDGVELERDTDVRGFTSGVNINGSEATGNLEIVGSSDADVFTGGAGDDRFYGLSGNDVMTGGGGSDQFRMSDWTDTALIQDFAIGEDKIAFSEFSGFFTNTTATKDGATLAAGDYVDNLQLVANLSSADEGKVVELQGAASEDQITQTTTASFTDATLVVFNSTSGKGEIWFDTDWTDTGSRDKITEFSNITDLATLVGISNTDFVEFVF